MTAAAGSYLTSVIQYYESARPIRPRYVPEDSVAYTKSRKHEVTQVTALLDDLFTGVPDVERPLGPGAPRIPNHDLLLCSALKIFYGKSWDFMAGIYEQLNRARTIVSVPSRATMGRLLGADETTSILQERLGLAASPLMALDEGELNIDSSWIVLPMYDELPRKKGADVPGGRQRGQLKLQAATGPYTNAFVAALVYDQHEPGSGDAPNLPLLLAECRKAGYHARSVFADTGYSSVPNIQVIFDKGGFPYVPFHPNVLAATSSPRNPESWNLLLQVFRNQRFSFMRRYGRRQNVEASFSALKRFASIHNRTYRSQINELLLMAIVYNIKRVNYFMHLLGLMPFFEHLEGLTGAAE